MVVIPFRVVILASVLAAAPAVSQEPAEKLEESKPDYSFWSGVITEIDVGAVTVRRNIAGRKPESRRFLLNDETVIEGELRNNARVTVAFVEGEEGDLAKRILVRAR